MNNLKKIHVNQTNIKKNIKGENLPVITVKHAGGNDYAYKVKITGISEVVYPEKALSCGARVWMQTRSKVVLYDEKGKIYKIIS